MKTILSLFLVVVITGLLFACGGGGGGGGSDDDGGGSTTPPPNPGGTLNPGLSGSFFFEQADQAYLMDVATGDYTQIPNTNWEDQNDRFPLGVAAFSAKPSYYGGELLIVTVNSCKNMPNSSLSSMSCIAIQDFFGNYIAQFDVNYDAVGGDRPRLAAELSRNHEYIALIRRPGRSVSTPKEIEIYDRSGQLLSATEADADSFEWLPDGRLVYAIDRSLYFTESYSTVLQERLILPDSYGEGTLDYLAVSPDGSRIAFSLVTDSTAVSVDGSLFVMDVESLGIQRLADYAGRVPMIRSPRWSPDGEWIAVLEGGADGSGVFTPGAPSDMYVVPSMRVNDEPYLLSRDAGERSEEVLRLRRYLTFDQDTVTTDFPDWDFYWVP